MSDASFEAKQTLLFLFFLPKKTRERFGAGSDWLPQHKKVGPSPDWSLEPLPRCHSALGPSPPLLTAVPESLRQPASDRAPGRGRRDEVDSDFSFFPSTKTKQVVRPWSCCAGPVLIHELVCGCFQSERRHYDVFQEISGFTGGKFKSLRCPEGKGETGGCCFNFFLTVPPEHISSRSCVRVCAVSARCCVHSGLFTQYV